MVGRAVQRSSQNHVQLLGFSIEQIANATRTTFKVKTDLQCSVALIHGYKHRNAQLNQFFASISNAVILLGFAISKLSSSAPISEQTQFIISQDRIATMSSTNSAVNFIKKDPHALNVSVK
ncbi:7716_t:CDS:2, partial [Gigaspora margarita]